MVTNDPSNKDIYRYLGIFDELNDGYQIIDRQWNCIYLNNAAARRCKHDRKVLVGHSIKEIYPNIVNTLMYENLQKCMTERISHRFETEFVYPDGTTSLVEFYIQSIPEGIVVLSRDVSIQNQPETIIDIYRRRLEETLAVRNAELVKMNNKLKHEVEYRKKSDDKVLLRSLMLEKLKEIIFLIDMNGKIIYANDAACRFYDYKYGELINFNIRKLIFPDNLQIFDKEMKTLMARRQGNIEIIHLSRDDTQLPVYMHLALLKMPYGYFVVCEITDLTKFRLTDESIRNVEPIGRA